MNLAVTPQEIAAIKSKGIDFKDFQRWRKIVFVQLKRINHKKTLINKQ